MTFVRLERYNAIKLVQSVHGSLAALSKVIRGTQLLTSDVQNLAAALLNQEVGPSVTLMSGLGTMSVKLAPRGTNPGLLLIRF